MNKLFMVVVVLGLQVFSMSASDKQAKSHPLTYIYQSNSLKPAEIIKTNCTTGHEEKISVLPGENHEEKTQNLMREGIIAWFSLQQTKK